MRYGIRLETNELCYNAYTTSTGNRTTVRLWSNSKLLEVLGGTWSIPERRFNPIKVRNAHKRSMPSV